MLLALLLNNMMGEAAALVTVPDVVGETQAAGTAELETALFLVSVKEAYSSTVAKGLIIEQSPAGGTEAAEGSTVTITVSLGENSAAGKSRHKRRYYVEIDGQHFPVNSADEARQLLDQARALAEKKASRKANRVVKKLKAKETVPEIKFETPVISASPEIAADVAPAIADIERLYKQAAATAELRLLMLKKMQDDDDEDELLLLL